MLVASDTGAAIWQAAGEEDLQDQWQMFSTQNSGLPSNRVLSLAQTEDGVLWFGTLAGLARYDNQQWQVYNATDLGLGSGQVNDLLVVNGGLWVATQQGAAFFDGSVWSAFDDQNSGLPDLAVFALAWQPLEQGGLVWFGTQRGLASYNPTRGTWSHLSEVQVGVDWGGVVDLLVDSQGRLWVSTLGGGIAVLDNQRWSYLRASNSDLPYNIVTDVEENGPGVFWIASSVPNTTGGVVSRLEGDEWMTYKPIFSGYTGAETLAIARDSLGRMWFATRTRGIYIFEEQK